MPRGTRLTRVGFKDFTSRSRREHGRFFTLALVLRNDTKGPRAACIVSKKVATRAVDRNLIKRRARAALAPALRGVSVSLSIALYAKKDALHASYKEVADDIAHLMSRVTRDMAV